MGEIGKFFSWEIIDDITAIKNCDKSFFEHNCSGVPKEIRWFFDSKDIKNGNKILLTLIYQDKKYEAHIEIQNFESPRTRMRWNGDLKKEFDEVLKDKDPMGAAILDYQTKGKAGKLSILSSMFEEDEMPVKHLFRNLEEMPMLEQKALSLAKGKVLDVGAGAGCHALALQAQ